MLFTHYFTNNNKYINITLCSHSGAANITLNLNKQTNKLLYKGKQDEHDNRMQNNSAHRSMAPPTASQGLLNTYLIFGTKLQRYLF